jgi:hypothetical protein
LLHRPTKLFLISAISIWKSSLVSAALSCNKLLQNRFRLFLAFWEMFENLIPKTPQQKCPFDQQRTIKKSPEARESDGRAHVTGAERNETVAHRARTQPTRLPLQHIGPVAASTAIWRCRPKIENNAQWRGPTRPLRGCVDTWHPTIRSCFPENRFQ